MTATIILIGWCVILFGWIAVATVHDMWLFWYEYWAIRQREREREQLIARSRKV